MDIFSYKLGQKSGGGSGGGADWNASEGEAGYVKNRTHYEEVVQAFEPIVWDGNTDGLESFDVGNGMTLWRMGDYIDIKVGDVESITMLMEQGGQTMEQIVPITEDYYDAGKKPGHGWNIGQGSLVVSDGEFETTLGAAVIPKGTWLVAMEMQGVFAIATKVTPTVTTTVKTLDEKYMPILTSPSGKKYKLTVDDSGTVSAVEVAE